MIFKSSELKTGENVLISQKEHPELGATFSFIRLSGNSSTLIETLGEEYIFDMYSGTAYFLVDGKEYSVSRVSPYEAPPVVLHVPCGRKVKIVAVAGCEIIAVHTDNSEDFPVKQYRVEEFLAGDDILEKRCLRKKRPFENRQLCPKTNLFCGELVSHQGSWICYPPHEHVEPEIYFYRFDREYGYAFVEDGDTVYRVEENDCVGITDFKNHSQAVAPGFSAFIFWAQRLQNNGKDIEYHQDPRYAGFEKA